MNYSASRLNQYTQRTVPGYATLRGEAATNATVTVNERPVWRNGSYFYGGDVADNTDSSVFKELEVYAAINPPGTNTPDIVYAATGTVFIAKTPEQFTYDADGNMTSDGLFHYHWNGENRLVCASNTEVVVTYAYDHRGRMVTKTLCASASLRLIKNITYIWDNWNIIREVVREGDSVAVTDNIWGLDLDGTLQGAGGDGGLLAVIRDDGVFLPIYDANGNVSEYVSTNGEIMAHYDYSPFGEPLVASGPLATTFTHQFSTKPYCAVTGFSEYVCRKYRPNIGRWMSKDPIGNSIYPRGDLSARYSFAYFTGEGSPIFQAGNIGSYVYVLNRIDTHDFAGLFDCKFNDTLRKCARPREGYDPVAAGRVNGCGGVGKIGIPFIGELPIEEVPEDPALILLPYRWHLGITPGIPYELVLPAVSCPFTSACNGHDKCYWTCNSDRAKCDDDFRKGMNALCDECRKNFFWKYDPRGYIWLLWCKEVAFMYYLGVRTGGWYDFEKFAQKEACEDCCCDEGKR